MKCYQPITFPNGAKTENSKNPEFFERDDLGERKWKKFIEPHLVGKDSFLEIGCNAGLYLVLAEKYGYKKVYGIENHREFFDQCKAVLREFNSKAIIYFIDALDFNYFMLNFDVVLLSNSLYWLGYNDSTKYIKDWECRIDNFFKELSFSCRRLVIVGLETLNRFGGKLELTVPTISKYFNIVKAEPVNTKYRFFNIIVADTKAVHGEIEIDFLIKEAMKIGIHTNGFMDSFNKLIQGYKEHMEWMSKYKDIFQKEGITKDMIHNHCAKYLDLFYSIEKFGMLKPIEIQQKGNKINIDGWHRLVIMKVLGENKIKFVRNG
jgi:SAM-dependent methyltransferase